MDLFDLLLAKKLSGSNAGGSSEEISQIVEELKNKISKEEMEEYVNSSLEELSTLPTDMTAHQVLVTDGEGVAKWEDKAFYENVEGMVLFDVGNVPYPTASEDSSFIVNISPDNYVPIKVGTTYHVRMTGSFVYEGDVVAREDIWNDNIPTIEFSAENQYSDLTTVRIYSDDDSADYKIKSDHSSGTVEGGLALTYTKREIHPLDPKFLPTTVPVIPTAQVGQTIVVKAVDENNKPTEWECINNFSKDYNDLINLPNLSDYYLKTEADNLHSSLENYVDQEVAALVNAAPETLDTIGELAVAFQENKEVVEALDASITNKQDKVSDTLILIDTITGIQHKIQIQNGQLVSFPVE